MTLRLTPEQRAEYERRCAINQAAKEAATAAFDARGARRARQAQTALYHEFERQQLPDPAEVARYEALLAYEDALSLEERVDRIELHLNIGRWA